jgi:quercetin dioxygenase-like cupin family protein
MTYAPSPRPTFAAPTKIAYDDVTRHLWGDPVAGEVSDWVYVSSDKIHQIVFGLPPRGWFKHSESSRTVFGADEIYYVIEGEMTLCNPETGEVHVVRQDEAAFFRKDTWHHAFNRGQKQLRVLEFMAPTPSAGASGAYARTRPYLSESRYAQDEVLGRWPMDAGAILAQDTIRVMRDDSLRWRLEGCEQPMLVGLLCATDQLTVGKAIAMPGERSDVHSHGGDESLYVLEGVLNVRVPNNMVGPKWFELKPGDGFYLPEGTAHQYYNYTDKPVKFLFGVAPRYRD